jgi:hypothetical protein
MPLSKFIHFTNANKHTISERTKKVEQLAPAASRRLGRDLIDLYSVAKSRLPARIAILNPHKYCTP